MNKNEYLVGDVLSFRDWLAEKLCGASIDFPQPAYRTIKDALIAYQWPLKRKEGAPRTSDTPGNFILPSVPTLEGCSTFAENARVLDILSQALRKAYHGSITSNDELSGAVAAILHWGGVYTKTQSGGNKPWLAENQHNLRQILGEVVADHAKGEDRSNVAQLRFNSGMTKVYSLLLEDFIIYDSRVAAALAWLVLTWCKEAYGRGMAGLIVDSLRFACPPGNGNAAAFRNPDKGTFKTLTSKPAEHYCWNVRANWLLQSAQAHAGARSHFSSLREIEAALFQLGNRVTAPV